MEYRRLGKTDLDVSVIGFGTEYLNRRPRKTVISIVHEAIERGVNYYDIIFAFPEYRDNFGASFKGYRSEIIIAGHLGCAETNGQYRLSRDAKENESLFHDLLNRLNTDYVDILMIQMVNAAESYDCVMRPGGLMELARRFQQEGKARFIGISGHHSLGVMRFIEGGHIDVLMFPVNLAWDFAPGRKEVLQACDGRGIGVVGMKIFAGGRLFQKKKSIPIDPIRCVNYVLSQPGVATTVPGLKNSKQLRETLKFLDATHEQKNFSSILADFQEDLKGNCVYCNHCLPCPVNIDIGRIIQLVDKATHNISDDPKADYKTVRNRINFYYPGRIRTHRSHFKGLSTKTSKCTECGICMERCPFDVDVISKMKQAVELFEKEDE